MTRIAVPVGSSLNPSGKTRQVTVSNISSSAITATIYARRIIVGEDPSVAGWPTTAYEVRKPASGDDARRLLHGTYYVFEKDDEVYQPGEIAGYVKTISGSTTFFIDEGGI